MNWILSGFAALTCWAVAYVLATKAGHNGAALNVVLEASGAIIVALFVIRGITRETVSANEVSISSCIYGISAGILTAVGLYIYLTVLEKAPEHNSEVIAIAGLNPIIAVVLLFLVYKFAPGFIEEASSLRPIQWVGVLFGGCALVLLTWDERWTHKLRMLIN